APSLQVIDVALVRIHSPEVPVNIPVDSVQVPLDVAAVPVRIAVPVALIAIAVQVVAVLGGGRGRDGGGSKYRCGGRRDGGISDCSNHSLGSFPCPARPP